MARRFIYRAPGQQALTRATLGYCGIRSVRTETFGPVIASDAGQRQQWLDCARSVGSRLAAGALSTAQRRTQRVTAWLAALRLQFYPMTWIAYTLGALLAAAGALLALTRTDLSALLAWSVAGGSLHAIWLWRGLHRLANDQLPDRIDGPIVLALTFILWFCVPHNSSCWPAPRPNPWP
ncbi:hypothetical protein ACVC7V_12380 [Hydrogenophaga sp. A37]|uniref:hypothetical protein n=1 Tax=Hydrogenophaga sp. A37 TaxID=1945864 RepID=UPI0009853EA1|nr:hypothetical protein [Hydrogenophaga sp. A37]OOG81391.1 hypothetical protein B0E41_18285 [Hydrogenophaga sp. A37]